MSPEFVHQIHELSSEVAQLKLSYVQDFSNFLSKLDALEAAYRDCKSLFEQMRSQLASHCENEGNLVRQLRDSEDCAIIVNFYDVREKIRRAGTGEKLLSLGVSRTFSLMSHEFRLYAEISQRNGANHKIRLYLKEYRPSTSFTKLTWPFRTMLEVHACQVTKNLLLECESPPDNDGGFVLAADILSMNELSNDKTVKEKDYFCVSIQMKSV